MRHYTLLTHVHAEQLGIHVHSTDERQPARNSCPPFAWFALRTPFFMYIHVHVLPYATYRQPKLFAHVHVWVELSFVACCVVLLVSISSSDNIHLSFSNVPFLHTERLAYDWIADKIYWSDYGAAEIGIVDFQTSIRRVLIHTGQHQLSRPRALALDPTTR